MSDPAYHCLLSSEALPVSWYTLAFRSQQACGHCLKGRGRWVLIRTCGDNSRVATIKLRYVKLAAIIWVRQLFEGGVWSRKYGTRTSPVMHMSRNTCIVHGGHGWWVWLGWTTKIHYLWCLEAMPLDSKHSEASFLPISTNLLYLQVLQVSRSQNLVIFCGWQ